MLNVDIGLTHGCIILVKVQAIDVSNPGVSIASLTFSFYTAHHSTPEQ